MGRRGVGAHGTPARDCAPDQASAQAPRQRAKKNGRGATYSVVVMTVGSLFAVAVLAAQAAATAPRVSNNPTVNAGKASVQPSANASGAPSTSGGANALPAGSGSGARIVYGEAAKRVWLVSAANAVVRTFPVVPGTVTAPTGNFAVTNRLAAVTGTDGTPVQYVVLFDKAKVGGSATAFGFDAVANVTGMPPAPASRTGGIRMQQTDAQALWTFSSIGTPVVVMP
ncbi:L,D-transpeptidase [Actinocrinis puniceicyclus]|uniref:L,D-transpeptidase n=1 Tax=Actinocrinis puniceicyclus TaxID=977794 RepID=A0A8J7WPU2_9ACTN|nr:L,D-transpeptidase [Actinocrinis puniceicyclus]MBS2964137.1 L,D-transpeptidase [Actinocrinis puniceicyclus]